QPVAQTPEGDAEETRGILAHASDLLERTGDDFALVFGNDPVELDALGRNVDGGGGGAGTRAEIRQGRLLNQRRRLERHRALDDVLELPHVAGVVVRAQGRQRLRRHTGHSLAELGSIALDEMLDEKWDVVAPLPEWGKVHLDDVQSVIEILPESALRDLGVEVA